MANGCKIGLGDGHNMTRTICDIFYGELTNLVPSYDMDLWFGEQLKVYMNDGKIHIDGPDKFYVNHLRNNYGEIISVALGATGIKDEIVYGVNSEPDGRRQRELDFGYPKSVKKEEDLIERCSQCGYLERQFYDKTETILHGGNRPVYREFESILESLEAGGDCWEPLIVHGENGLGKTHAMDYLLYEANRRKIPSVGFSLSSLVDYLNPNMPNKAKEFRAFKSYTLAKNYAKLSVVDQAHATIGGTYPDYYHRKGTQSWLFALEEGIKSRGGNLVYAFTDTKRLPLEKAIEMLMDEKIYSVNGDSTVGNRDLGDRMKNHFRIKIDGIPAEEEWEVINGIVGGNGALVAGGMSPEQIVETIRATGYGEKTNIRRIVEKVKHIVRASRDYDVPVTRELIMKVAGSKRAKTKFAIGGFNFNEKSNHDSGSFLDNYSPIEIKKVILSHVISKEIPLNQRDSKLIREISLRWLSNGGDENTEADKILRLRDGSSSQAEFRAMKKLFSEYKKCKNRLF